MHSGPQRRVLAPHNGLLALVAVRAAYLCAVTRTTLCRAASYLPFHAYGRFPPTFPTFVQLWETGAYMHSCMYLGPRFARVGTVQCVASFPFRDT